MDIDLDGMDEIAGTRAIRRMDPVARIVMVTEHGDQDHVPLLELHSFHRQETTMNTTLHRHLAGSLALLVTAGCQSDIPTTVPQDSRVASVEVTPAFDTLTAIGDSLILAAVARDSDGNELSGVTFTWSSSAPEIMSVGSGGVVTAVTGGVASARVSAGKASDEAEIHVIQEVSAVEVSPSEWSPTWIGARVQLEATATDANGHAVADAVFEWEWTSLDPTVAGVDDAGVATARSVGNTEISATHEELSGAAAVSVTDEGSGRAPGGLTYSVWVARSYRSPAMLVDGSLTIPPAIKSGEVDQVYGEFIRWASDGKPPSPWSDPNVAKFEWSGNRIGLLTDVVEGLGTARLLDRTGEWFEFGFGQVRDLQLHGSQILVLDAGGRLLSMSSVRGGSVNVLEPSGVVEFKVAFPGVVSWLRDDGTVHVDAPPAPTWTAYEGGGVRQFHATMVWDHVPVVGTVSRRRVGILLATGEFRVRTGARGDWQVVEPSGVVDSKMYEDRIALLKEDGTLLVKDHDDDSPDTPWTVVYGPVKQFDLVRRRIAILTEAGEFLDKDGATDAVWSPYGLSGVRQFELQDTLTAVLTEPGHLFIRKSINRPFESGSPESYPPSSVTQIRPLVHVPMPPRRMDPAGYERSRDDCRANAGDVLCLHRSEFAIPVPEYGRFCGGDLPREGGGNWDKAEAVGPLDPLDELCHNHDYPHTPEWYYGLDSTWDLGEAACIVRYGLHHSRLTRDGTLLTKGSDSWETWNAQWGSAMPDLKDGLDNYFLYTEACTDDILRTFTEKTRAPWYYR